MSRLIVLTSLLLAGCATVPPTLSTPQRADRWWNDVSVLASEQMEGRLTGSPGYQRAADYVVAQVRTLGLQPAGTDG